MAGPNNLAICSNSNHHTKPTTTTISKKNCSQKP